MNELTKRLEFDEVSHNYTVNGVLLPSVTEIVSPVTYSKYSVANNVVEQAAYRGTMVHQMCADYDLGIIDDEYEVETELAGYLAAWMSFCRDFTPEWEYVECKMAANDCAGTVDRIGIIDGRRVIVDIKTSASMDRAAKVSLCAQIYGYDWLAVLNDIKDTHPADSMGVQLKKDGTYTVHLVRSIEAKYAFNAAELWQRLKEIQQIAKGVKDCQKS